MDVNQFFRELFEYDLGLDAMGLENQYRELVRMIDTKTLTTWSNYVPARLTTYIDMRSNRNLVRKDFREASAEYYIDEPLLDQFDLQILGLGRLEPVGTGSVDPYDPESSAYYSSVIASRQVLTLENVLMSSEATRSRSLINTAYPWQIEKTLVGPRTVRFKNITDTTGYTLELMVPWPNVVSLPTEYKESFKTLCKLDIKTWLWTQLKFVQDVVTPNGNLDLRISDWESAERDRDEYLRNLKNQSLGDRVGSSFFYIL